MPKLEPAAAAPASERVERAERWVRRAVTAKATAELFAPPARRPKARR